MNYEELEAANNRNIDQIAKALGQYTGPSLAALHEFFDVFIVGLKAEPVPHMHPCHPTSIDNWARSVGYQIASKPIALVEMTERIRRLAHRYNGQLRVKALLRKWDISGNAPLESKAEMARQQLMDGGLNIDDELNETIDKAVASFKQALLGYAFDAIKQLTATDGRYHYTEQIDGLVDTIYKRLDVSGMDGVSARLALNIENAASEACRRLAENRLNRFKTNETFLYKNTADVADERTKIEMLFGLGGKILDASDQARLRTCS